MNEQEVIQVYERALGRPPESAERITKCIKRYADQHALKEAVRNSPEYKNKTQALSQSYAATDQYQPVYSRPDLSSDHARTCDDRCAAIAKYCRDVLGAGQLGHLSVLDVGCSQGFVSLYFADRGAHVVGVDYNRDNITFCRDLAAQSGIDALFKQRSLDGNTIDLALSYGVNAVFLLSVLHHVINERGLRWTQALVGRMLENGMVLFCELAHKDEQVDLDWRAQLPEDERSLFPASAVVTSLGTYSALNGLSVRTLYAVHGGEIAYLPTGEPLKKVIAAPTIKLSGVTNAPVRIKQYAFGRDVFTKTIRFTAADRLEIIRAATSEYLIAKTFSDADIGPKLLGTIQGEQSLTIVYQRLYAQDLSSYAAATPLDQRRQTAEQIAEKLERIWALGLHWNDCREHNILVDRLGSPTFIDFEFASVIALEDDRRRAAWMLWHFRNTEAFAKEMERSSHIKTIDLPEIPIRRNMGQVHQVAVPINQIVRLAHILVVHSVDPSNLLASIPDDTNALWLIFFHGDDLELSSKLSFYAARRKCIFFNYAENRGLARSWNDAIALAAQNSCTDFLLLNDDLFFYEDGYQRFVTEAKRIIQSDRDVGLITPMGLESGSSPHSGEVHLQMFACSIVTRNALEKVGYFDQTFFPAYFEDSDYSTRMRRVGLSQVIVEETLVEHARSSTLRANSGLKARHEEEFTRNRAYFQRKWGDYTKPETLFSRPFNDGTIDCFISEVERHSPYKTK